MAKILILYPNTERFGRQSIPIALISALLKQHGHDVLLLDTTFYKLPSDLFPEEHTNKVKKLNVFKSVNTSGFGLEKENIFAVDRINEVVKSFTPDAIFFSFWGCQRHAAGEFHSYFFGLKLIENCSLNNVKIFVGGTVPTWDTEECLKHPLITGVVRGEGETAFLDIANNLQDEKKLSEIKNLWFKSNNNTIVKNDYRPLIRDFDNLPLSDYTIYEDRSFWRPYHGKMVRAIDAELSRGCPNTCTFCLGPFQKRCYQNPTDFRREKSIDRIIKEISYLKKTHNLDLIRYNDESFLDMSEEKMEILAHRYKKEVDLPFIIEATIRSVTPRKIELLKIMGCLSISFGIESGNSYIRNTICQKPFFTNEEAIKTVSLVKKHNISCNLFNIIGFPEETKEMIFETIELNYNANPPHCFVSFFQPWEGTSLRDYAVKHNMLDENIKGLDNSRNNINPSQLNNLKVSSDSLQHLHSNFQYYVYVNKFFWPLIRYVDKNTIYGKLINLVLKSYLRARLYFI